MQFGDAMHNNRHMGQRLVLDDQLSLHYVSAGHGPAVILVHGIMHSLYTWRHNIQPLADAGFSVYAPDLAGFGYSDRPPIHYSMEDQIEILLAFCDSLDLSQVHMVGVGEGATLVMAFALAYPDRVHRLAAISPGGIGKGYPWRLRLLRYRPFGEISAFYLSQQHIEQYLLAAYFDETHVTADMIEQYWLPQLMPGSREALLASVRSYTQDEVLSRLHEIAAPMLLVWGEHDFFHPAEESKLYQHEMPQTQLYMVNHCGHLVHEERAAEFNRSLIAFLSQPQPAEPSE